jgi:ParB family chromosome partitioning protein
MMDVEWDEDLASEGTKLEERRTEIDETIEGLAVYSKKDRARAGCIVTIGDHGQFELHQGLLDRSGAKDDAHAGGNDQAEDDDNVFVNGADDDDEDDVLPRPRSSGAEQALRKELGLSQSLVDDLKAHRLQITRAHLAADFGVAFDLALYALCAEVFDRFRFRANPLDLRTIEATPRSSLNDLAGTAADRLLDTHRNALDLAWIELPPAERFEALAALPVDAKQRLFAWCIAATLKPQLAIEDRADPVIESAGYRLAIAFADFWRPTAANYWGRAKKAHGLDIGRGILGDRWARDHADDKKPVLAAALETAFDPAKNSACISLDRLTRDAAAVWLPPGMVYGDRADTAFTDPALDEPASDIGGDAEDRPLDVEATDLPAFLTEDEQAALNGAAAS